MPASKRRSSASALPPARSDWHSASSVSRALIDIPWQITVGSDLQHPRVQGTRTAQVRFIIWYIAKLFRAAQRDGVLAARFVEVANLTRQPESLLDPRMALLVWKGNRWPLQATATPSVQQLG